MGWFELLLAFSALGLGLFALRYAPTPESTVPWLGLGLGAATVASLLLQAQLTGPMVMDQILALQTGWVFIDPWTQILEERAGVRIVAFASAWPVVLGTAWLAWTRRWRGAVAVVAGSWAALVACAAPAVVYGLRVLHPSLAKEPGSFSFGAASVAEGMAVGGGAWASLAAAATIAAIDDPAGARWATAVVPGVALLLAAWATPPDVVTLLVMAPTLLVAWTLGLALGHGLHRLR